MNPQHPPNPASKGSNLGCLGCLSVFCLAFVGFGLWLAIPAARKLVAAPTQSAQVPFVIGAVLTGFGICVTGFGLGELRKDSVLRRDLARGRIRAVNTSLMRTWWGYTSILALVSGGCIWMILQDLGDGKRFPIWGLITPFMMVGSLAMAISSTLKWVKFRHSFFNLATQPVTIGGRLQGVIETSRKFPPATRFRIQLSCIEHIQTGIGRFRHVEERVLWQGEDTQVLQLPDPNPARSVIPVAFSIPRNCRESDDSNRKNQIIWWLEVTAKLPGADYLARFQLPVLRTVESAAALESR